MGKLTLFALLVLSLFQASVVALPRLFARGEGIFPDVNWGGLIMGGAAALEGINLLLRPDESDRSGTVPQPDVLSASGLSKAAPTLPPLGSSSNSAPLYKLEIHNGPLPTLKDGAGTTEAPSQGVDNQCDPSSAGNRQCDATIDQLIFTTSCVGLSSKEFLTDESKSQNQELKAKLTTMMEKNQRAGISGLGLRISTSKRCDVFLFTIFLTLEQIEEIKKTPGVHAVVPNRPASYSSFPEKPEQQQQNEPVKVPEAVRTKVLLNKRDTILEDFSAYQDLRFISTPEDEELSDRYSYYSAAGHLTTLIMFDSGVNALHDEFTGVEPLIEGYIYGQDAWNLPSDYTNRGTCRASKAVGPRYGVAKRATLLSVKVAPTVNSIIDAMVQTLDYLDDKIELIGMQKVVGFHVLVMQLSWENINDEYDAQFEALLDLFMVTYQIVVVVPATITLIKNPITVNEQWPEALALKYPIIVVGSVDVETGLTYPWSRPKPYVAVNAPGGVKCAANQVGGGVIYPEGNDVAAMQVAALAGYYLSGEVTGPFLLLDIGHGFPETVKGYIMNNARVPLRGDYPAIYNLVHKEEL